jgi:hypothetical protein
VAHSRGIARNRRGIDGSSGPKIPELLPVYENVWRTLDRANIAVYPLEDLVNPAFVGADVGQPLPQHFDAHSNVSNLESFAEATGGRLCDRQTTALGCFREAVNDSSDYYLIGFYENSGNSKPGWRRLAVKVDLPEMQVRARSGYFFRGPQDENLVRKEEIQFALTSSLESTGVPLTVRLTLVKDVGGKKRVGFIFVLPPAVAAIDESDGNHINLNFAALAKTPDGTPVAVFSQNFEARLNLDAVDALKYTGAAYPGTIDVPPGEYTVRFVIRDNLSGLVGSTSASLKVP